MRQKKKQTNIYIIAATDNPNILNKIPEYGNSACS